MILVASRWAGYALALLLPLSIYWPVGRSSAPGVLDVYARPGLYPSDLALAVLLLAGWMERRRFEVPARHGWLLAPFAALIALALLTAPLALSPALAAYTALR